MYLGILQKTVSALWRAVGQEESLSLSKFYLQMRVVKEIPGRACKITVFSWNGKYIIKLENGPFEQTFKVSEFDILEEELDDILSEDFLSEAMLRFNAMAMSLKKTTNY